MFGSPSGPATRVFGYQKYVLISMGIVLFGIIFGCSILVVGLDDGKPNAPVEPEPSLAMQISNESESRRPLEAETEGKKPLKAGQ